MNIAPFVRRWGILLIGSVFLACGLALLISRSTLAFGWASYAPLAGMAFFPGLPASEGMLHGTAFTPDRYASFSGQISIALGLSFVAGWFGFVVGKRVKKD